MPVTTPLFWRDQYFVNPVTSGIQQQPVITALSNGNIIVVFEDRAPGGERNITGILLDARGNFISSHNLLAGFATGREDREPSISPTRDGGFVLAFEFGAGDDDDIRFARFNADVTRTREGTVVNDTGSDTTYLDPDIIWRPGGTSVVVYEKRLGELEQIAYRIIAADGSRGPEVILRSDTGTTVGNPTDPAAALLDDGSVVVVFEEDDNGEAGIEYSIIAPNGDLSAAINVSLTSNNPARDPDVAATANGGFVVVWDQSDDNIYARRYDADGVSLGLPFLVANNFGNKNDQQVVGLPDGGFFVTWDNDSTSQQEGRRFDADGEPVGGLVVLGGPSPTSPDITLLADGRIMVVWDGDEIDAVILDPRDGPITVDDGTPTTATPDGSTITGSGADDLFYGWTGRDTLSGKNGDDDLYGGASGDRLFGGRGADHLLGVKGNDRLDGDRGNDRIFGNKGNDDLRGGNGNDQLYGGDKRDDLRGGTGNDQLTGGGGRDLLTGGTGADRFIFTSAAHTGRGADRRDVITDFGGNDRIDLRGIDADLTRGGNQAFDFIGTRGFADAGDLRIKRDGADRIVQVDRDGDGATDFEIRMADLGGVNASDFLL